MKLLAHSAQYAVSRGIPGVLSLVALALFSRLLTPDEYGKYAVVLATIGLAGVFGFQWLMLVVGRFLPSSEAEPQRFMSSILALFVALAFVATAIGALISALEPGPGARMLAIAATSLLVLQAWTDLNLAVARANLRPWTYGQMSALRALTAVIVGAPLALLGFGAMAPLLGLAAGNLTAHVTIARSWWRSIRPTWPTVLNLRAYAAYGMPLTITFALMWIVSSSDRILISWFLGADAVGHYAVGYDLVFPTITLMASVVNTAALPLAIRAMEREGVRAASDQLSQNGRLLLAILLASAVGWIILGPSIVAVLVGPEFRPGVLALVPTLTIAAAIAGAKSFHFDIAFHLAKRSHWLVMTSSLAASVNVALNIVLIPALGVMGAAYATVAAYAVAVTFSAALGPSSFPMPALMPLLGRATPLALAAGTGAWIGTRATSEPALSLAFGMTAALLLTAIVGLSRDEWGVRTAVESWLRKEPARD